MRADADFSATLFTLELKERCANYWRDKDQAYWFARLVQEVGELGSSLVGDHADSPDWELSQIAAICLNWLEYRDAPTIEVPAKHRADAS